MNPLNTDSLTPTRMHREHKIKLGFFSFTMFMVGALIRLAIWIGLFPKYYQSLSDEMSGRYSISPLYVLAPYVSFILIGLGLLGMFRVLLKTKGDEEDDR